MVRSFMKKFFTFSATLQHVMHEKNWPLFSHVFLALGSICWQIVTCFLKDNKIVAANFNTTRNKNFDPFNQWIQRFQ